MNKTRQAIKYIIADYLSALMVWVCFFAYRKIYVEPMKFGYQIPIEFDENFYLGLLIIPMYWLTIYLLMGSYRNVFKKSRLKEIGQTATQTSIGVIILFFALVLDDEIANYTNYYITFLTLFTLHFFLTAISSYLPS